MIYKDRFYKLEMLILALLDRKDENLEDMKTIFQKNDMSSIKQGKLLASLFFFLQASLVSSYQKDGQTYYHIESAGRVRLETLKRQYQQVHKEIEGMIHEQK